MITHLHVVGCLLIALAILHAIFPTYFNWKNELRTLSLINRQMMHVHTFFIALIVFLMGFLCVTSAKDLLETELGHRTAFGLFVFWLCRLIVQFVGYSAELWRRKRFETTIHILFVCLWTYISVVFLLVVLR